MLRDDFEKMADEVVLSFHDSLLRKSDLNLLEEGRWLNDRLIGFMFDYFTHKQFDHLADDVLFINPDVAQFLKFGEGPEISIFIEPLNFPSRKLVFFAVNDNEARHSAGGSHWSLLMYSKQASAFYHYDSHSPYNKYAARSLANNIDPFTDAKTRPSFHEEICPQQENSYDCGMYVISVTEHLCKSFSGETLELLSNSVTASSIRKKRRYLKDLIHELGQTKT